MSTDGDSDRVPSVTSVKRRKNSNESVDDSTFANYLPVRRAIMKHTTNGEIQSAITKTDALLETQPNATTLRKSFPNVYAQALCQNFVEMIRNDDSLTALLYARSTIVPLGKQYSGALVLVRKYLPLLAYKEPHTSPVFDLVDFSHRFLLADQLNGCVMAWLTAHSHPDLCSNLCTFSPLERMLRQCILVMRKVHGNQFCLDDALKEINQPNRYANDS